MKALLWSIGIALAIFLGSAAFDGICIRGGKC